MEKKKVLILITKSNWGGAQRYVFDVATALPKDIYDVEVMSGSEGILTKKLIDSGITASGSLAVGRDISFLKDIKAFFELISILRKKRPDILHLNSSKIGGIGALAGRLARVPRIIFTSHGWAFNENRTFISKIIIKFLHWITIVLSHRTISVSETLKEQIGIWPMISDKIVVVHNGIKVEPIFSKINAESEFKKVSPLLQKKLEVFDPRKTIIIGTIGELHHIKGYEYALRAMVELLNSQKQKKTKLNILYLIIGTGEEKEKLEKMITDLNIQENVILLGYVQDAFNYMRAFDIFLLPSLSESFGYVILEAGLARLPVVATAVGGVPEIVDDMESGILIQPKKPREIKNAIEYYLTNKTIRKEHSEILNKKVVKEFSIGKMIAKTVDIYNV